MEQVENNIYSFSIGQVVIDEDGAECKITDRTGSSIELFIQKKTDKGIDCKQYFGLKQFNDRFKRRQKK